MIKTDILIVGAGPVGLFTVFEAGLLKLRCHLVDALPQTGGQLSEIYPKKPIYDIPGYPTVLAGELVDNLMEQIAPFKPSFTLGERVEEIEKTGEKEFTLTTNKGTKIQAPIIAIAGGLGSFEPRKPPIEGIAKYEDNGVDYMIKDPEKFRDKTILIAGGGDSALDWTIKVMELAKANKVQLITEAQAVGLEGNDALSSVLVKPKNGDPYPIKVDNFIPLFGLTPKLGPIANWGLGIQKSAIEVDTFDYSTNVEGIYAIGDINTYPGKLKLILCGFHEATLMVQSAFKYIYPDQKLSFKYTTVTGIQEL